MFTLYNLTKTRIVLITINTLKRIYNWPPSFCYILRKEFGEKYK